MNYQQFIAATKEKVALSLGDGMQLHVHTTLKNNGHERIGLTISDNNVNIFPTIYLEEFYQQYQKGYSLDEITESIVRVYHDVKFEHTWQVNIIKEFSVIKSKIVYKLIHAKKNEILLQDIPYVPYMDLAIVFYVLFDVDDAGIATIPINNELVSFWKTTPQELYLLAKENTIKLLPASFKPMRIVIEELLGNECKNIVFKEDIMFVLTNQLRNFGAACLLYDGILQQIAIELGENYYILPSSIHEMIIVPESKSPDREQLIDMITEINETQVEPEEILSDNVYYYDHSRKQIW